MKRHWKQAAAMLAVLALAVAGARANNLVVKNVSLEGIDDATATIRFDVSWENAWRDTDINHDAAWVFFKVLPDRDSYRRTIGNMPTENAWQHVILERSGHETGSGTPIEIIVPEDRVGIFVRKAGEGHGDVNVTGVKAVWNFATNGLTKHVKVQVQAMGIEMVYVPEGAFYVGSGGTGSKEFREGGFGNTPFKITTAGEIGIGDELGKLFVPGAGDATLSAAYPNGYAAFYSMKYEVTQGQYADFLNTLTEAQAGARFQNRDGNHRHTISGSLAAGYSATAPDRACNYLTGNHAYAFADWSGLRPMSELEYEKACRGPVYPVADGYAWGTTNIVRTTSLTDDGTSMATADNGNCNYNMSKPSGPFRVGIYATATSTREEAGASYWGIMELSGNLMETAGTIASRFNGLHGDGVLTSTGGSNVPNWPLGRDAIGYRGGGGVRGDPRVSDRSLADTRPHRVFSPDYGFRGVRTAPSGLEP